MMRLTYKGPDTLDAALFLRSTSSAIPPGAADADARAGWRLQLFRTAPGGEATPLSFPTENFVGESVGVPAVGFRTLADFRRFVPACPDANYAWRLYGKVEVEDAGDYTLCTTSDDGSLLYMDLKPGRAGAPVYTLLIDNDGLHGDRQACRTLPLAAGEYATKVRRPSAPPRPPPLCARGRRQPLVRARLMLRARRASCGAAARHAHSNTAPQQHVRHSLRSLPPQETHQIRI
jgi:hypothetical protein